MLIRTGLGGQLSGSTGGVTASRNRYGQYLRNRTVPVNPNTARQQAVRSAFANAAAFWAALTDNQRQAWKAYADGTTVLNKLGETVTLTGNAMFLRTYQWFTANDQAAAVVSTAPNTPGLSSLGDGIAAEVSLSAATGFAPIDASSNISITLMSVQIGPPLSPGANYPGTRFSFFGSGAIDTAIAAPAPTPYGALAVGQRRPIRLTGADDDGKLCTPYVAIVTVVA